MGKLLGSFFIGVSLVVVLLWGLSSINPVDASSTSVEEPQVSSIVQESPTNNSPLLSWDQRSVITYSPGVLIVKFQPGIPLVKDDQGKLAPRSSSLSQLFGQYQVLSTEALIPPDQSPDSKENQDLLQQYGLDRVYRLQLKEGNDVQKAAEAFSSSPEVEWAEPDYLAHTAFTPNAFALRMTEPKFPKSLGRSNMITNDSRFSVMDSRLKSTFRTVTNSSEGSVLSESSLKRDSDISMILACLFAAMTARAQEDRAA